MKLTAQFIKNISLVTQFSISLIVPVLICLGACWLIRTKTGAGMWIYIIGFVMGLGGSFMVAYKLFLSVTEKDRKENRKNTSFNDHV